MSEEKNPGLLQTKALRPLQMLSKTNLATPTQIWIPIDIYVQTSNLTQVNSVPQNI